jgi:hypothetical protein
MTVTFDPLPHWPAELRNLRGLHGAISALRARDHHDRFPAWSLRPWLNGWAVHFLDDAEAREWAGKSFHGALWDRPTRFSFGPLVRMRAPVVSRRGRSRIRLDVLTPVVLRTDGGAKPCTLPTAEAILGALRGEMLYRLSPSHRDDAPGQDAWTQWVRPRVRLQIAERNTESCHVPMGGKYGVVSGWQGYVILDVNAVAYWLLVAAERTIGLGGRGAFGFGRIRVSPC